MESLVSMLRKHINYSECLMCDRRRLIYQPFTDEAELLCPTTEQRVRVLVLSEAEIGFVSEYSESGYLEHAPSRFECVYRMSPRN